MSLNPCAMCGKEIKPGREKLVKCQKLGEPHGKRCPCLLPVGSDCFRKLIKEGVKK